MFFGISSLCSSSLGGTGAPVGVVTGLAGLRFVDAGGVRTGGLVTVELEVDTGSGGMAGEGPVRQCHKRSPRSSSKIKIRRTFRSLRFIRWIRIVYNPRRDHFAPCIQ